MFSCPSGVGGRPPACASSRKLVALRFSTVKGRRAVTLCRRAAPPRAATLRMSAPTTPSRRSMLGTQHSSSHRSAPSYGFGTAERSRPGGGKVFISKDMVTDQFGMNSPGPVYHPKSIDGRFSTAPSHSFGTSHRYSASQQKVFGASSPGPGQHMLPSSISKQMDSQKQSYSSWTFGTSTRQDQAKVYVSAQLAKGVSEFVDSPGPVAYEHSGAFNSQIDSRKKTNESYGLGTSQRFFYEHSHSGERAASPGPGTYNLRSAYGRQVTSDKPSYPSSSFPKADRDKTAVTVYLGPKQQAAFWGRNSPGPAVYTLTQAVGPQNSSRRPNMPKFGFGTSDRFAYMDLATRASNTPGPGSYSI
ncbi:hypothetical protein AB1Y20_000095 [Prymnesium parvum]|uniref:Uncharacterized protein n=1 Tax=Prymnesium parvum TaxID=97485 RepID=A0AB34K8Z5_PRYPA